MNAVTATLAAALLLSTAKAADFVRTQEFGDTNYHDDVVLTDVSTAGLIVGWATFGLVIFISGILIIIDSFRRHRVYDEELVTLRNKMKKMGIDIPNADAEFAERRKGKKIVEEDAMEAAAEKSITEKKKKDNKV